MLRKHAATIVAISPTLKYAVRVYFALSHETALTPALYQRGLGQADLVLALLRIVHPQSRTIIGLLIGHPIVVGEPCLLRYRSNGPPTATRETDSRRVVFVVPGNPRQPGTDAHLRWHLYQLGRSVSQLRSRGVKKRDMRRALRMGWIRLEETRT